MNDEIKEILEDWKIGIETGKDKYGIKVDGIGYTWKELKLLLDYITNLQQRVDEAIEFINEYCKYNKITVNGNKYYDEYILNNVIDILRGEDND